MPIVYQKKLTKDSELAIWKITETPEELYQKLQLNEDEKAFYKTLNHGKRNMHWLGSRVLLRTLLNTSLYIDCQLDENNKPYLVNFPYEFSITHSNDLAAVIICKGKKVGIDIEKVSTKIERIAKKFLSEKELEFISEDKRVEHMYVCWGAKESLFKLYGKGNLPFIEGIHLEPFIIKNEGNLKAEIVKEDYNQKFKVDYIFYEDYVLTWVVE
jgi:4'-phosphopantetheinyl transferase